MTARKRPAATLPTRAELPLGRRENAFAEAGECMFDAMLELARDRVAAAAAAAQSEAADRGDLSELRDRLVEALALTWALQTEAETAR
ncbi:MAG TPA: hypothetical protein VKE40_17360 [Gemmataceae bacterium]|nr:hypothetical protein [Gemmataceae bacterium]